MGVARRVSGREGHTPGRLPSDGMARQAHHESLVMRTTVESVIGRIPRSRGSAARATTTFSPIGHKLRTNAVGRLLAAYGRRFSRLHHALPVPKLSWRTEQTYSSEPVPILLTAPGLVVRGNSNKAQPACLWVRARSHAFVIVKWAGFLWAGQRKLKFVEVRVPVNSREKFLRLTQFYANQPLVGTGSRRKVLLVDGPKAYGASSSLDVHQCDPRIALVAPIRPSTCLYPQGLLSAVHR